MKPQITKVEPKFALPGGELHITGSELVSTPESPTHVRFGQEEGSIVFGSRSHLVAQIPEEGSGPLVLSNNGDQVSWDVGIAQVIAENLHPVANPAVDRDGNVFVTFSGSRGQSVPIAIYKVDTNLNVSPYVNEMMNATGLALDAQGYLYVSSRFDGTVYQVAPGGAIETYAQGMGVATGIAFDKERNLFVGDRTGTIFKIAGDRQIYVFATLEPSMAAYHLAFGPNGNLYVTSPSTSSNDAVYEIDPHGSVSVYFRGLGRPQGLAFDDDGNIYVAASLMGNRGIVRIDRERRATLVLAGNNLVGLAFAPDRSVILATNDAVHHLEWGIAGRILVAD